MKKVILLVLALVLITSSSAFASTGTKEYTEKQLDQKLLKAGVPEELLTEMDYAEKNFIVTNSPAEDLKYGGHSNTKYAKNEESGELEEVVEPSEGLSTMASIPQADLSITTLHFTGTYNGVLLHDIYSQWEWIDFWAINQDPSGISKDHIAIAVPDGYEIQDNRYACGWQSNDVVYNTGWSSVQQCGDAGYPQSDNLYGSAWEFNQNLHTLGSHTFKGTAKLSAKKVNSGAINRAISVYNQANANTWGGYSVNISYGPVSVTFTPTAGSADQGSDDVTW